MSSLLRMSATQLKAGLLRGEMSSVEIVRTCLDRIAAVDPVVSAFLWTDPDYSLEQAAQIDRRRSQRQSVGCLAGLPVAIKDVLCTRGLPTTCGSRILAGYRPPYNATVVEKLARADAVLLGKTNLDEFAMGGSTENSAFATTRNPWDLQRVPGGSSGGSAACVAACMSPLSIGTDTGGSIRQPASYCGIVGLKPSYGRVSRFGLVAFASSLDQIGPLAWNVEDVALLLEAIAGHDPADSTSVPLPVPAYSASVQQPLDGLKLGMIAQHYGPGLDPEVAALTEKAIDVYRRLGADVRQVSLDSSRYAIAAYYVIAPCEASSNLARYDGVHFGYRTDEAAMMQQWAAERRQLEATGDVEGLNAQDSPLVRMYRRTRAEGFGPEVKRRIMLGTYALSAGYYDAYYLKAQKVRRLIRQDYDRVFQDVDFIVGPVAPSPAFSLGKLVNDPLALYLQDLFTVGANLAGIASIAVPCGFTADGLPVGLQLQSPPFAEERLLRAAAMYQRETDWHTRRPSLT
jgi:aspartyl-tRNA(Asn)/glutamyl-tRNA(Gln) amidotransferase subunit A